MTIIDDYLNYQEKYAKEYGENTIVLMQVGHFFEVYAVDNEKEKSNSENIYRLSDIMNIQLTRKNKSIKENSRKNPMMIGINLCSSDKYIQILLNANYTIIMMEQITPAPNPERAITNIYSPGINIQHQVKGDSSNCVAIYMEVGKDMKNYKDIMSIGISCIDLSTGKNKIFETFSNLNDKTLALDEAFRFIQICDPKEIVFYKKNVDMTEIEISGYLDLTHRVTHFKDIEEMPQEFFKISYQSSFLKKIFKNTGLLSVIEYIDCERKPFGLISYISLLDFAYKHNEKIIDKIEKPSICLETNNLILTNNSINQLNVVAHTSNNENMKFNSLFAVINNTSTSLGRRYLKEQLVNPIINKDTLNLRYQSIEALMSRHNDNPRYLSYEECLKKIIDIERLHRRMGLKMLQPADFGSLDTSYKYINDIFAIIKETDNEHLNRIKPSEESISKFNDFIELYNREFELDIIVKYHMDRINNSFFKRGIITDLDVIQEKIDYSRLIFEAIAKKLSHLIEAGNTTFVKVDYNEVRGHHLICTTKRCQVLKSRFQNMNFCDININMEPHESIKLNPKDITFKTLNSGKTNSTINMSLLENTSHKLISYTQKIHQLCLNHYLDRCSQYYDIYGDTLKEISEFVGKIDVIKSNAKTALIYGYSKPQIQDHPEIKNKSFIDAKAIRHPIIERIQTKIEYVTNDVKIGIDLDDKLLHGMLLYGTNAAGKSSLMKAIGLNLIMAQAGMFVPCESFVFNPFNQIFTRINNNDNIFKGESSFAVEMGELRSILFRSNQNSLVLGDELCSGTESISAQSIFASSVISLVKKNACFIFATHLHELTKLDQIRNLDGVEMFHLKVKYDLETKKLIYDRKLQKGSGQAIYGLEVCLAMDMDTEFLDMAHSIRRQLLGESDTLLNTNNSQYNQKVYIDKCQVCGENAEDVHHIKFQCMADENNMIGHLQKDQESNLVPLCKKCHMNVHNGNLDIYGYMQSSDGIKLDFKYINTAESLKKKSRKKFTDEQIEIIEKYMEENRKVPRNFACEKLKTQYNIDISKATLGKIVSGKY